MPRAGEVYHYPAYVFPDGEQDDKYVVLLGQIPGDDWILARTTSRQHGRSTNPRCNQTGSYPSFYIGPLAGIFPKPTWLVLDRLDDHDEDVFTERITAGLIEFAGELPFELLCDALSCARGADDATQIQVRAMSDLRAELGCA